MVNGLIRKNGGEKKVEVHTQRAERKPCQPRRSHPAKLSFKGK